MNRLKLFFSYSHKDKEIVDNVRNILQNEYIILGDHNIEIGDDWATSLFEQIKEADYYISFLSGNYTSSTNAYNEFYKIQGYLQGSGNNTIIPVLIKETILPSDISNFLYLNCVNDSSEIIAQKIITAIYKSLGKRQAEKERIEKINTSINDFIEPILKDLKERETKLKSIANCWNILGYSAIIIGIILSACLIIFQSSSDTFEIQKIIYLALKGAVLLILLLTASKYSFVLSKSYMNESLKNADRIHAISFGKFYVNVYEKSMEPKDFKEVFQNWNLNHESSFSSLSTESYDPKIVESISKFIEILKNSK